MSYVKVECVGYKMPALVCLEDISFIGPEMSTVIASEIRSTRRVAMKNGVEFVVTPLVAEKLEAMLLPRDYQAGHYEAQQRPCVCRCPRCAMFPHAHAETHVDCCGRQLRGETWVGHEQDALAVTVVREDGFRVYVSAGKRTPQSGSIKAPPGYFLIVNGTAVAGPGATARVQPGDLIDLKSSGAENVATAKPLDEACSACGAAVFETPSGLVCTNGHGGAGIIP